MGVVTESRTAVGHVNRHSALTVGTRYCDALLLVAPRRYNFANVIELDEDETAAWGVLIIQKGPRESTSTILWP